MTRYFVVVVVYPFFAKESISHKISKVTWGDFIGMSFVSSVTLFESPIEVSLFFRMNCSLSILGDLQMNMPRE